MKKLNKRGFTLIEIISVITILSLIIVVVGTKGFGAFDNAKIAIDKQNMKAIKEAANVLMIEVEKCEELLPDDLFDEFSSSNKTCEALKTVASTKDSNDECLKIGLKYLLDNDYITGSGVKEIYNKYPDLYVNGCLNEKIEDEDVKLGE